MTVLDPTTFDPGELAEMLTAWAQGSYDIEAAVGLLTHGAGGLWLRRRDFLTNCVEAVDDGWSRHGPVPMAFIDWDAVTEFIHAGIRASSGEAGVLRAADCLAGADVLPPSRAGPPGEPPRPGPGARQLSVVSPSPPA